MQYTWDYKTDDHLLRESKDSKGKQMPQPCQSRVGVQDRNTHDTGNPQIRVKNRGQGG